MYDAGDDMEDKDEGEADDHVVSVYAALGSA